MQTLSSAAPSSVQHIEQTPVDRLLECASAANGAPIVVDPAVWRALVSSAPVCPHSAAEVDELFAKVGAILLDSDDVSFAALERDFQPAPFSPPRFRWEELAISVAWKNWSGSMPLNEAERRQVTADILARTRPVPLTAPSNASAGTRATVSYLVQADARTLRRTDSMSLIAVIGGRFDIGRLVYGRIETRTVKLLWDSPLFSAWWLRLGYSDLDGDGREEILVSASDGANGEYTLLTAFDTTGRELTRQQDCRGSLARGLVTEGITCPISGVRMEIVRGTAVAKDILVWEKDSASPVRYALRNQLFVRQ